MEFFGSVVDTVDGRNPLSPPDAISRCFTKNSGLTQETSTEVCVY